VTKMPFIKVPITLNQIIGCFSLLLLVGVSLDLSAREKNIVIVHSYNTDHVDWVPLQESGFKSKVGAEYTYHTFYMDTKNLPKEQYAEKAIEALTLIDKKRPHLVYVTDDNATRLVGRFVSREIPVVFSGVNANIRVDYPWILNDHQNITGVLERPLIKRGLVYLSEIVGVDLTKVLIIMGKSTSATAIFQNDLKGEKMFTLGENEVHIKRSEKFEDWKKWVAGSKGDGYTAVYPTMGFTVTDENSNVVGHENIARWISANTPIPPITVHTSLIGKDMLVGCFGLNGKNMGEDAGDVANEILVEGKLPASIKIKKQSGGNVYLSKSQLAKWGLNIPPESELVRFVD